MKVTSVLFVLLMAQLANAREINVGDHGIAPGKDVTLELYQLFQTVQGESDLTLIFPTGTYYFSADNAWERYRAVSNHDNGLKRIAFPLFHFKNITIDGRGSKFLFQGHMIPFTLESVQNATLKNFTIDWVRSFHAELEVIDRNIARNTATFRLDPEKYPHRVLNGQLLFQRYLQTDPIGSNIVFDPKTRAPIYKTNDYKIGGKRTKALQSKQGEVTLSGGFRKSPPPVGSVLVVYGVHPTSRLAPAIHVTNSRDLHIQDITVHEAGGMALIVERTENVTLDHMVVSSNEERLAATRADATHFIGCKGSILVENCLFEHMLDDSINVHGAYIKVEEYLGEKKFLCEISHFQQWGLIFAEPGDEVAVLSRKTILPHFKANVTAIEKINEKRLILTLSEVPDQLPPGPLSIENLSWYPDLTMRKNIVRENRARSVLVTTKGKVLIEDNYFSSQMHGILIEGDNNKWYESGAVEDVTIRNNVFENIGFGVSQRYPLIASPLLNETQHMGAGQYHRNITFANNTIKSFNGLLAKAASVTSLEISGNTIEFSSDYPPVDEGPAVVLEYCDDVTIQKNVAKGFDVPLIISCSTDSTDVAVQANDGIKLDGKGR